MYLLILALVPVVAILIYVYYRDQVEKEPAEVLVKAFVSGAVATVPILLVELLLSRVGSSFGSGTILGTSLYGAFIVAAATEESFKFAALSLTTWRSSHFDHKFDGIVYAVFVSLGFAAVENILFVLQNGSDAAFLRALTAVPAHAAFGIAMGYHYSLAKFFPEQRDRQLIFALGSPLLLHGFYDFCLMSQNPFLLMLFVPYILFILRSAFIKMDIHSDKRTKQVPLILPKVEPASDYARTEQLYNQIAALARLKDEGLISSEEFESKKNDILNRHIT